MSKERKSWSIGILVAISTVAVGFVGAIGWLSQQAQAARCLDCDIVLAEVGSLPEPVCPYGVFSCPPWNGGHGELTIDNSNPEEPPA